MSTPMLAAATRGFKVTQGVVVSAGLMDRTVKVRVAGMVYNKIVQKLFNKPVEHLVHDPNNSLVEGDLIAMQPGWRTSKHKRFVVTHILAAAGKPVEERPPVLSMAELIAQAEAKRSAKLERRAAKEDEKSEAKKMRKLKKKQSSAQSQEPSVDGSSSNNMGEAPATQGKAFA